MNRNSRIMSQIKSLEEMKRNLESNLKEKTEELEMIVQSDGKDLPEVLSGSSYTQEQKIKMAVLGRERKKLYESIRKIDVKIYELNKKKNLVSSKTRKN